MNILLYTLIFAPDVCSNAYVFSDIAKELKRCGNNVTVITTTPHYDETTAKEKKELLAPGNKPWYRKSVFEDIRVFHIDVALKKGGNRQRLSTYYRFHKYALKLLNEENITADIILTQTPPPITVALTCNKLAKRLNAKSVLILQDLWLDAMIRKEKIKAPFRGLLASFERRQYDKMDAICTISDVMANVVAPKLRNVEKLTVIPNFVDTTLYHPVEATPQMRQKYGVLANDFVISYVGNLGNAQDLTPLLAFAKEHQNDNLKVLIAGNGTKETEYRQLAAGVNNVFFLGYVPREETLQINAVSDVCMVMLAEHITETSFPSKIYTIMAMGKPILITCAEKSAAGAFVEKNQIGWSVRTDSADEFARQISSLIQRPATLHDYGNNSLHLIETDYSQSVVVGQYVNVFENLLK